MVVLVWVPYARIQFTVCLIVVVRSKCRMNLYYAKCILYASVKLVVPQLFWSRIGTDTGFDIDSIEHFCIHLFAKRESDVDNHFHTVFTEISVATIYFVIDLFH